jgi:hypothetical protein
LLISRIALDPFSKLYKSSIPKRRNDPKMKVFMILSSSITNTRAFFMSIVGYLILLDGGFFVFGYSVKSATPVSRMSEHKLANKAFFAL